MLNIGWGNAPAQVHASLFRPYGLLLVHQEVVQVARDVDSTAPLHESNFVGVLTVRYLQCMCEALNQTTAATTMIA